MQERSFHCDREGYVRHWIIAGTHETPFHGRPDSDDGLRRQAVDPVVGAPPAAPALGAAGPFGKPWRFYAPGENQFVEQSGFWHRLEVLDLYAATEIVAPAEGAVPARLWVLGCADLWVNGAHVARINVPKYMYPVAHPLDLPLRAGANQVCVRLQGLGLRDTRYLFGLQVLEGAGAFAVRLPGPGGATGALAAAEEWLAGVRADARRALQSPAPAPEGVSVKAGGENHPWPAGAARLDLGEPAPFQIAVRLAAAGQTLERALEIPANLPPVAGTGEADLEAHRRAYVLRVAERRGVGTMNATEVIARHLAGRPDAKLNDAVLEKGLQFINERNDCADFTLAMLLRLTCLKALTPEQAAKVRQTALAFRYWSDEAGTDAMCFGSENHALLFHGCQLIAGRLFPEALFAAAQRTGAQQAEIGAERCRQWLAKVERQQGFQEFLSSTYLPITAAALLNLVDFSGDADLSRRAAAQVDRVLLDLAAHSFDGVTVGPQGRVYRGILTPQASGAQGLLYYASPHAVPFYESWAVFLASSPGYRPPAAVETLLHAPAHACARQADVEIALEKTAGYMLTSLQIPASFSKDGKGGLQPGRPGYQQHLWHAALGRDCHVFVNHPGASFDLTMSRPGYWYGNGVLPRLAQKGALLGEVFDIPEGHPIAFTHAHWPADAFRRQEVQGHWAFGAGEKGYVALWCSSPLEPHDEVLTGRELRAWSRQVAWLCVCGDAAGLPFEQFQAHCRAMAPAYSEGTLRLADGTAF